MIKEYHSVLWSNFLSTGAGDSCFFIYMYIESTVSIAKKLTSKRLKDFHHLTLDWWICSNPW